MPIRRFRSAQEMEDTLWRSPGEPALFRAIENVWDFVLRTCPRRFPPGVYKHRSIDDAQRLHEEWAELNFRRHHAGSR